MIIIIVFEIYMYLYNTPLLFKLSNQFEPPLISNPGSTPASNNWIIYIHIVGLSG